MNIDKSSDGEEDLSGCESHLTPLTHVCVCSSSFPVITFSLKWEKKFLHISTVGCECLLCWFIQPSSQFVVPVNKCLLALNILKCHN